MSEPEHDLEARVAAIRLLLNISKQLLLGNTEKELFEYAAETAVRSITGAKGVYRTLNGHSVQPKSSTPE